MSRVPPHWWWREPTQQVQMSPPLLLSESWEQTWLEMTAERFPNTLPLPPALDLEKLCRGRGDSVSLTRSTWSLTSGCKSICKHRVPVGLPKSFDYSVFGQAAYRQLIRVVGTSWSALFLLFSRTQAVLAAPACADFGSWFSVAVGQLSNTVQTYFSFFQFLAFLLSEESKKTSRGDSSCEEDMQSPRSQMKKAIISQVRAFRWQDALG